MKLEVNLKQNPYDIIIEKGALKGVGQWVKSLWEPQKIALITDNHVGGLYAEKVKLSLEHEGFEVVVFNFLEGEASKNLKTVNKAYEFLIKNGMTRSDGIVALGGGVVGDLAGFVASTYMRGIHFVQVPTSLTAQVDSSIGGKTGVNTPFAKNIVGTFAQRMYLNFGHTIGHAVEQTAGYGKVMHGEAVAIGMVQISRVAEKKNLIPQGITRQIAEMCVKFGLPVDYEPWRVEELYTALTHDKKARGNSIKTVIVPEIGKAAINQIPLVEMKEYLEK